MRRTSTLSEMMFFISEKTCSPALLRSIGVLSFGFPVRTAHTSADDGSWMHLTGLKASERFEMWFFPQLWTIAFVKVVSLIHVHALVDLEKPMAHFVHHWTLHSWDINRYPFNLWIFKCLHFDSVFEDDARCAKVGCSIMLAGAKQTVCWFFAYSIFWV